MTYTTLNPTQVQHFLNQIEGRVFTVVFLKKDGTQRMITGMLDVSANRKENVPVMDIDSGQWKSFNINRVLDIREV